ncbi:hypothetical protein BU15DRAFT_69395 [Melanogaster broomeanus]|nr:hypothetical protein BU15DRAFT_69395 [Melanogaster broomeanus]
MNQPPNLPMNLLPMGISLQSHPTARDKAVSDSLLSLGSIIVSVGCLANVLLPNEKGRRCDFCLSLAPQSEGRLQRCTGCASYWYCGTKCQTSHWPIHKKYCKNFNRFCASRIFQQLESHEKLDALLLTHLLAKCSARGAEEEDDPDLSIFMSLLTGLTTGSNAPPTCPLASSRRPTQAVDDLFSRCGNNNFSIHSHLTTIAHGVFPLASRQEVRMEIVALCDIAPREEICIPYVDPALLETRQQMFQLTYGFTCTCPSCTALDRLKISQQPAPDGEELASLGSALQRFVFPVSTPDAIELPRAPSFSTFSHEGPFESALEVSLTVLAFYTLVYPPITLKSSRGSGIISSGPGILRLSNQVLAVIGPEGDEGGPLAEVEVLDRLLNEQGIMRWFSGVQITATHPCTPVC